MKRILYTLTALFTIVLFSPTADAQLSANIHVWPVSRLEMNNLNKAIEDYRNRKWQSNVIKSFNPKDPVIKKIVLWKEFVYGSPALNFKDVTQFMRENPHWPYRKILESNAEGVINDSTDPDEVIRYFAVNSPASMGQVRFKKPVTSNGKQRLAEALIARAQRYSFDKNMVPELLTEAWIEGNFTKESEQDFLSKYQEIISKDAIERRIDRLLTDRRTSDAARLVKYVSNDYRKLFEARMAMINHKPNSDMLVRQISRSLQSNPGLTYERIKWRVDRNVDVGISDLVESLPSHIDYPEKIAHVRKDSIKKLMDRKNYKAAYLLAKNHSFTDMEDAEHIADFEWYAGWISLRFLHDPKTATTHFRNIYAVAQTPITIARATYWLGRAAEEMHDRANTEKWYNVASKYPITFYGQLGALKAGKRAPEFPTPSTVSKKDIIDYRSNELAKAAYIMLEIKENKLGKEFLKAAAAAAKTSGERVLIAQMGLERKHYDYSLNVSKDIYRQTGEVIMNALYPVFNLVSISGKKITSPPDEYTLAIIRQESEFDTDAKSPAGARGLMQLMPPTAQMLAKKLGVPFNKNRLTGDPRYNVTLGSEYLASRLRLFDGSYVLSTASYNAGEGNVKKWIKEYGDPRDMTLEQVVDWIEMIPFSETNNYVQRVTENMQIYRIAISGKKYNDINTDRDLTQ